MALARPGLEILYGIRRATLVQTISGTISGLEGKLNSDELTRMITWLSKANIIAPNTKSVEQEKTEKEEEEQATDV